MSAALEPEIIRSFMAAIVRCLRATVGADAVVATLAGPQRSRPSIAVALDLDGEIHGPVTWVFPQEIALELVRRLMADPDPAPEMAVEGATELANILTGHGSRVLEEHGFRCEFGPPRVHVGAIPVGIVARITTAAGPIDVVLSLSSDPA